MKKKVENNYYLKFTLSTAPHCKWSYQAGAAKSIATSSVLWMESEKFGIPIYDVKVRTGGAKPPTIC